MKQIKRTKNLDQLPNHFYLFSFGANDPPNLAKRLFGDVNKAGSKKEVKIIQKYTSPAFIPGYLRSFFGYSDVWNGSVGTLIRTKKKFSGVHGLITELTHFEKGHFFIGKKKVKLKNLCKVENIDGGMYVLQRIMITLEGIPVYAFMGRTDQYKNNILPSRDYLNAVGKTLQYSFPNAKEIHIPIRVGENREVIYTYRYRS